MMTGRVEAIQSNNKSYKLTINISKIFINNPPLIKEHKKTHKQTNKINEKHMYVCMYACLSAEELFEFKIKIEKIFASDLSYFCVRRLQQQLEVQLLPLLYVFYF